MYCFFLCFEAMEVTHTPHLYFRDDNSLKTDITTKFVKFSIKFPANCLLTKIIININDNKYKIVTW